MQKSFRALTTHAHCTSCMTLVELDPPLTFMALCCAVEYIDLDFVVDPTWVNSTRVMYKNVQIVHALIEHMHEPSRADWLSQPSALVVHFMWRLPPGSFQCAFRRFGVCVDTLRMAHWPYLVELHLPTTGFREPQFQAWWPVKCTAVHNIDLGFEALVRCSAMHVKCSRQGSFLHAYRSMLFTCILCKKFFTSLLDLVLGHCWQ